MTKDQEIIALKKIIKSYEILIDLKNDFHAFKIDLRRRSTQNHIDKIHDLKVIIPKMKEELINRTRPDYFTEGK